MDEPPTSRSTFQANQKFVIRSIPISQVNKNCRKKNDIQRLGSPGSIFLVSHYCDGSPFFIFTKLSLNQSSDPPLPPPATSQTHHETRSPTCSAQK